MQRPHHRPVRQGDKAVKEPGSVRPVGHRVNAQLRLQGEVVLQDRVEEGPLIRLLAEVSEG